MEIINGILAAPFICFGWIIVGAIAGALARTLMGTTNAPFIADLLLGIIGAFVGGFIASLLNADPRPGSWGLELVLLNLLIATIGAVILIAIRRVLFRSA